MLSAYFFGVFKAKKRLRTQKVAFLQQHGLKLAKFL